MGEITWDDLTAEERAALLKAYQLAVEALDNNEE